MHGERLGLEALDDEELFGRSLGCLRLPTEGLGLEAIDDEELFERAAGTCSVLCPVLG